MTLTATHCFSPQPLSASASASVAVAASSRAAAAEKLLYVVLRLRVMLGFCFVPCFGVCFVSLTTITTWNVNDNYKNDATRTQLRCHQLLLLLLLLLCAAAGKASCVLWLPWRYFGSLQLSSVFKNNVSCCLLLVTCACCDRATFKKNIYNQQPQKANQQKTQTDK